MEPFKKYKRKKSKCIDCNKEITLNYKRCHSCAKKFIGSKPWSEESKINIRGANNHNWKGENVKYRGLHAWVDRHKPKPKFCEECKIYLPQDLANISGEYKRDINDFKWLCRKCHMTEDGRLFNLKQNNGSI